MLYAHCAVAPSIHSDAVISPAATVIGNVTVGSGTIVLAGAVLTAESAPVHIGRNCVIMEHAVIRGAGIHPCAIGDYVLAGPHSHISGARIEEDCFLATGSTVMNGAQVGRGSTVAINGVVHISAICAEGTFVPIAHVALGQPAHIYAPGEMIDMHKELARLGFTRVVFGFDSADWDNAEATRELCTRYARSLMHHRANQPVSSPVGALPA